MLLKDIEWRETPSYDGIWSRVTVVHLPDNTSLLIYRVNEADPLSEGHKDYAVMHARYLMDHVEDYRRPGYTIPPTKYLDALELQCLLFHYLNPLPEEVT